MLKTRRTPRPAPTIDSGMTDKALPRRARIAVIGRGRLGQAITAALGDAQLHVQGPLGRGEALPDCDVVLLCVPERAIGELAATIERGPLVGHCSASAPLDVLGPHERFVMHPLMTFTKAGGSFDGVACAIDGSSKHAVAAARQLAKMLGMRAIHVAAEHRALYHAAAVMASNFLVTLEDAAERAGAAAGIDHAAIAPLARASLENWARWGSKVAITGPIARGDEDTEKRLRTAIAKGAPELLHLWDALAAATRAMAARPE